MEGKRVKKKDKSCKLIEISFMYTVKINIKNSILEKVIRYLESFSDKNEIVDIIESDYNSNLSKEQERVLNEREEEYLSGSVKIYSWEEAKFDLLKK